MKIGTQKDMNEITEDSLKMLAKITEVLSIRLDCLEEVMVELHPDQRKILAEKFMSAIEKINLES